MQAGGDPTQPSGAPPPPTVAEAGEPALENMGGAAGGSEGSSLGRTASRAVFWNAALFPLRLVASLVSSVLITSLLQPRSQFGLIVLISGAAATIGLYGDFGIERSLPRFVPEVERAGGGRLVRRFLGQLIGFKLLAMAVLITVLLALSGPLLNLVADKQTPLVVDQLQRNGGLFIAAICAMLLLGALFDTSMQFLSSYFKQRAWNVITIASGVLQPLLIISFFGLGGAQVEMVVLAMVVSPLVSVLLAGWQALRLAYNAAAMREGGGESAVGAARQLPTGFLTRFTRYSALSYFMNISVYFYTLPFISLVLNGYYRADGIAIFAVAYNFVNTVLTALWSPLSGVQIPLFSRIYTADRAAGRLDEPSAQLQGSYDLLSRFLALVLIPSGIGLALLSASLVANLFPSYREATLAAVLLILFLFAEALISIPNNILIVYERFGPVLLSRGIALISIPLLFLLVPVIGGGGNAAGGATAAALATGLARLLSRAAIMYHASRHMHLRYPWRFSLKVGGATLVMGVAVGLLAWLLGTSPFALDKADPTAVEKVLALLLDIGISVGGGAMFLLAFKRLGGLGDEEKRRLARLKLPLPGWAWRWL